MASITMDLRVRFPEWREDYLRLIADLGGDADMAIVFVLRNTDYTLNGGRTWKRFGSDEIARIKREQK